MFSWLHEAGFVQLCSLRSHRIEHGLSPAISECTGAPKSLFVQRHPMHPPTTGLRKSLHWLPTRQRIIYKVAMLAFKVQVHGQLVYLADLIVDHTPFRTLRSSGKDLLIVLRFKTQFYHQGIPCRCSSDLPLHMRLATSASSFRKQLKTHLWTSHIFNHHRYYLGGSDLLSRPKGQRNMVPNMCVQN